MIQINFIFIKLLSGLIVVHVSLHCTFECFHLCALPVFPVPLPSGNGARVKKQKHLICYPMYVSLFHIAQLDTLCFAIIYGGVSLLSSPACVCLSCL